MTEKLEPQTEPVHLSAALRERMQRLASIPLVKKSAALQRPAPSNSPRSLPQGVRPSITWSGILPRLKAELESAMREANWPVFVHGGIGCGKTSAMALVHQHWRASQNRIGTARWFRCDNLINLILKARYGGHEGIVTYLPTGESVRTTEGGLFDAFARADLVCLDDIGTSELNREREPVLLQLLDSRAGKRLLITSNHAPEDLEWLFDPRIASRVCEGRVIHATGDDRRMETAKFTEA